MSEAAFDDRVAAYAQSRTHREGPTLDLTLALAQTQPGDLVLDVSTGTGFTAHALAAMSARVVAADIAPNMLRHTRATAPNACGWCRPTPTGWRSPIEHLTWSPAVMRSTTTATGVRPWPK